MGEVGAEEDEGGQDRSDFGRDLKVPKEFDDFRRADGTSPSFRRVGEARTLSDRWSFVPSVCFSATGVVFRT